MGPKISLKRDDMFPVIPLADLINRQHYMRFRQTYEHLERIYIVITSSCY